MTSLCSLGHHRFLVLAITLLGASAMALTGRAQPYSADILHWRSQDLLDPPPQNAIVFVGSSSIRRWEELTRDFADYNVIQRGIGGALFDDLFATSGPNSNLNDLVLKYAPRAVVVWAGTNDLASGSDGNEVFADYQQFVTGIRNAGQNPDIFYLGIMPTPGRQSNLPQENIANSQIAAMTAGDPKLHYVDLPAAFATLNPYGDLSIHIEVRRLDPPQSGRLRLLGRRSSVLRCRRSSRRTKFTRPIPRRCNSANHLYFRFWADRRQQWSSTINPDLNGHYWNNWTPNSGGVASTRASTSPISGMGRGAHRDRPYDHRRLSEQRLPEWRAQKSQAGLLGDFASTALLVTTFSARLTASRVAATTTRAAASCSMG